MSSPSTSPAKSRWSRMGGAVRRASSVLVATRPSTPSIASDKDSDAVSTKGSIKGSIKGSKGSASLPIPSALIAPELSHAHKSTAPSPIAESPAREAAASQEETFPIGPSPLAQDLGPPQGVSPAEDPTSPQGYIPPPLLNSNTAGLGPGAFTDELDELPQSQAIRDPSIFQPESTDDHGPSSHIPETVPEPATAPVEPVEPQPVVPEPTVPEPTVPEPTVPEPALEPPVPVLTAVPEPTIPEPTVSEQPVQEPVQDQAEPEEPVMPEPPAMPEPEPVPPMSGAAKSYFDIPIQDEPDEDSSLLSQFPTVSDAFKQSIADNNIGGESAPAAETTTKQPEGLHEPLPEAPRAVYLTGPEESAPAQDSQGPPIAPLYPMPVFDMNAGQEVWGGVAHDVAEDPAPNKGTSTRSRASSIRPSFENPFADPIAPRIAVSHAEHPVTMPHPHISEQHHEAPNESHENVNGSVVMPLPALHEVVPSKSIDDFASTRSIKSNTRGYLETDETLPLLSRPDSPKHTSYLRQGSSNNVTISPQSKLRLHDLGWIEYQLPDGAVYYVHPTRRVTTDIDLRIDKKLDTITGYLLHHYRERDVAPAGMELWLREAAAKRNAKPLPPIRCWVDHKKRSVVVDLLHENKVGKSSEVVDDDQLDIEYRYWSFMEAHPAHTSLPVNARAEAMDVLTWAWTDRLLPSHRTVPAPFTQEECQELMSLLRSFGEQGDAGLQTVVHTRIVSRILLRVAHWRQEHFRPDKPLPTDVSTNELHISKRHRPFRRALFDILISCVCLGIPYIFFQRTQHHRLDEESGLRNAAPMFVVGACTCLIAAIVLSASVTFLSLPGLDSVSRIAGFVAILLSSFSMASTVVALFRYKADLERPVSHVGGEGLLILSRRSVVMSLPLVFLAYAIIGFVVGVVLYSFRGVSITNPSATEHHFDGYTRWTVVGFLGGLTGVLTTSLLLLRR